MNDKYQNAICILAEMLLELKNDNQWKNTLLETREKEIERLKMKVEYLEGFVSEVSNRNEN